MINIDPELRSVKAHALPASRWALAALQNLLSLVNAVHRRKFKSLVTRAFVPSTDEYAVPVLVIRPDKLQTAAPALIYFHGGAFVMRHAPQHMENAVCYAEKAQCVVFLVEYRLAPKSKFPSGFEDCCAVVGWAAANATRLGIDQRRLAIGGDSAGGGLAAGVAQRIRDEGNVVLKGQMLIYPVVDLACKRPSITAFADVPPFKKADFKLIAETYIGRAVSAGLPLYSSPMQGQVTNLPRAYVETAEYDLLHDQGMAYAQALSNAGVHVEVNEIGGGIHGFDLLAAQSQISKEAMRRRIDFLRDVFQ